MHARRILTRLGIALAVLIVVVLGGPLVVNAVATGRPVLGLQVAGESRARVWTDASAVADGIAARRAATTVTLTAGDVTQTRTLDSLGLVDRSDELHAALLDAGRDGSFWQDVVTQTRAVWGREHVAPPPDRLDPAALGDAVDALADKVAVAPTDASVALTGGQVEVTPDVRGVRLDTSGARDAILDAVHADRRSADLPTDPVPASVTSADLTAAATAVSAAVERPLVLAARGTRVTVAPERVFAALPVTVGDGGANVGVDAAKLSGDIDAVAGKVDREPELRIVMADTVVAPGVEGHRLDKAVAAQAVLGEVQARAAGGGSDVVTLPVTTLPFREQEATPGAFTGDTTVHLTFDDGPGAHTEAILDILKAKHAHATFYVVGDRARQHPETIRRILAEGHRLGNHSATHADLTKLTPEQVTEEIATTQELLTEITGVRPTAFRPPFGAVNDVVRAAAADEHVSVDLWTLDPQDWRAPGATVVRGRVLASAKPGSVVLLHVLQPGTVDALPGIIEGLRARGLAVD
ncbi:polysaccharide deacetylase family protein [Xylanimonas sp. McL0601]|uniref:polysaccharide deacetylase family protein n=1 Tax=Xylanimonas sp. McL0601 TaxID=3414739 RepID=UPI003CE67AC2